MRLDPINLYDFEARAKQALPHHIWDFIEGGAFDEITTGRNRRALDAVALRPRFLVDVWDRELSTTVLGHPIGFPVMIAPAGGHGLAHPEGELATARAAGKAGTIMFLSTSSNYSMEEVAAAASGPLFFQLYHRGYDISEMLVHRAEEAGYAAICLTVDTPVSGPKERDIRNRFVRPRGLELGNFHGQQVVLDRMAGTDESTDWNPPYTHPLTWRELEWLRSLTSLPLILKGIRTGEDARLCVENGVDGILVSNHGGRQVDGTLSSIETLPEIVEAAGGRAEIYMDGGIRRGIDVLRALALGARAVLIGRPLFWGLAVDGEAGVGKVLQLLRQELDRAMGYCGVTSVGGITRSLVSLPGEHGWVSS
jgi:isopentenyl diphosphate isomerase/L-lactate dehydrogenase-like FMN-dependent dehydrogenase